MRRIFLTIIAVLAGVSVGAVEVTVPSGQAFKTVLATTLHSETSQKGQSVNSVLSEDFVWQDRVIAPAGSTVAGTVADVSPAKMGRVNGTVLVRFNMITTGDGTQIPISAVIKSGNGQGVLSGGTTAKAETHEIERKDAVSKAGMGAIAGFILSPFTGGAAGRGTMVATAVGAGNDMTKKAYTMGEEVLVPIHSPIEIVLVQPIKFDAE